jgi:hypothetical protein
VHKRQQLAQTKGTSYLSSIFNTYKLCDSEGTERGQSQTEKGQVSEDTDKVQVSEDTDKGQVSEDTGKGQVSEDIDKEQVSEDIDKGQVSVI